MFCKTEKHNLKFSFFGSDESKVKGREAGSVEYFVLFHCFLIILMDILLFCNCHFCIFFFCNLSFALYFGDLSLNYFVFESQIFKSTSFQIFEFM